jgi:hypothetical protein
LSSAFTNSGNNTKRTATTRDFRIGFSPYLNSSPTGCTRESKSSVSE